MISPTFILGSSDCLVARAYVRDFLLSCACARATFANLCGICKSRCVSAADLLFPGIATLSHVRPIVLKKIIMNRLDFLLKSKKFYRFMIASCARCVGLNGRKSIVKLCLFRQNSPSGLH